MSEGFFAAHPDVIDCDLAEERALLHMQTNTYFTLNPVAADLWAALDQPRSFDELVGCIVEQYEVAEDRCREDVGALLDEMVKLRVVTRTAEKPAV